MGRACSMRIILMAFICSRVVEENQGELVPPTCPRHFCSPMVCGSTFSPQRQLRRFFARNPNEASEDERTFEEWSPTLGPPCYLQAFGPALVFWEKDIRHAFRNTTDNRRPFPLKPPVELGWTHDRPRTCVQHGMFVDERQGFSPVGKVHGELKSIWIVDGVIFCVTIICSCHRFEHCTKSYEATGIPTHSEKVTELGTWHALEQRLDRPYHVIFRERVSTHLKCGSSWRAGVQPLVFFLS